jgi:hypothetical protein
MLTRQYGKHKSTYERNGVLFSRIISTVKTPLGQRGKYAVVQYILKKNVNQKTIVLPPVTVMGADPIYRLTQLYFIA